MNCSDRVRNAMTYKKVDRIPAGLFGTSPEYEKQLGLFVGAETREAMYRKLAVDVWHTGGLVYKGPSLFYQGRPADVIQDFYGEHNPWPPFAQIRTADEIMAYPLPSIEQFDGEALDQEIRSHEEFALCTGINAAIFHNYLYMCGQENALCLLKEQPDLALAMISRITDFWVDFLKRTLDVAAGRGVFVENCNDFGTQNSMFISAEDFRHFFKPQLKRLCDIAHSYGVLYMQHSCGDVYPILADYLDIGVDVLNPVQVMAKDMALASVVGQYKGRLAFYGGIDTQYLLPQGPIPEIQATVRRAVSLFGADGGFILSGSQGLMDDIPYAHAAAMLDVSLRSF